MQIKATFILAAAVVGISAAAALAADMPRKAPPPVVAPPNWTGFYAGVHAGWGWTSNSNADASSFVPIIAGPLFLGRPYDVSDDGPLLGVHLGYNWQVAPNWVVGIEGDWTGTGLRGFQSGPTTLGAGFAGAGTSSGTSHMQRDVNWLASVRGRLGYTWGPNMIYATGGVAWADVDVSGDAAPPGFVLSGASFTATGSSTHTGWVGGAGYETMLSANWLFRAEYLYYALDGTTITGTCAAAGAGCGAFATSTATYRFGDLDIHTARIGLSYKFGGAGGVYAQAPLAAAGGWTGFYAGAHAGWGFTSSETATGSAATPAGVAIIVARPYDVSADAPVFGIHLGYNWQLAPSWVVGVEGDWTGTGLRGFQSGPVTAGPGAIAVGTSGASHMQRDVNWLASVRGRLGYTWANNMVYATGGVAWVDYDVSGDANPPAFLVACCAFAATGGSFQTGWTIGGGYETMILQKWMLRAEYLYYAFDGITISGPCTLVAVCPLGAGSTATYAFGELNIHTARLGLSYKF